MDFSRRQFLGAASAASLGLASRLQAQGNTADLVLFNGKILTVDDAFSIREAIVIKDGRIVAVGGNELRNRYTAARTIDLKGRTVMPGFLRYTHPPARQFPALCRSERYDVAYATEAASE